MARCDNLGAISEGLELSKVFLAQSAESAFLKMGLAKSPYDPQVATFNGFERIVSLFGANQCLRCTSQVLMADKSVRELRDVVEGDEVMAYDFDLATFIPSRVNAVFFNDAFMIHRFKHSHGILECTRSHKVAVAHSTRKHSATMVRVVRACKQQLPVIVYDDNGCPTLSKLKYLGEVCYEPTMDICIDHPDHAFVCNRVVTSNSGKALPDYELVLTPDGYVPMGSIKHGDTVCTPDGRSALVTGVYPQGEREVWEISFNDKTSCRCDIDHLWKVRPTYPKKRDKYGWQVLSLREILRKTGEFPSTYNMYEVPKTIVNFSPGGDLPLDPYALGLLIGDGSMTQGTIGFTSAEPELVDYLREHLPVTQCRPHGKYGWIFTNGQHGGTVKNMLKEHLNSLGLLYRCSQNTFIPDAYKMASADNRLSILQGLMDADGTADKNGCAGFASTSKQLAEDVAWVLRSLGERCTITKKLKHCVHPDGHRTPCDAWEVYIGKSSLQLFRMKRKIDRMQSPGRSKPRIMTGFKKVEPSSCTCITIDSQGKLFITKDFIPTHNSHAGAYKMAWDATGLYPDWYNGPRTVRGIDAWVMGKTGEITRDSCQYKLFGVDPDRPGWTDKPAEYGLIPAKYILGKPSRKSAPNGAFDMVRVKHVPSDTTSVITFKSYQMERQSLAAWHGDRVWIDEECPLDILEEMIARVSTNKGQIIITMCPLDGVTPTVKFLLHADADLVRLNYLTYDDAKHLDPAVKEQNRRLWASNPAMMAARTEGKATSNSGLIFPFDTKDIIYDPARVSISPHWKYLGGMDVGWRHPTAAVAMAWDTMSDAVYCYATYEQTERPYLYHHAQLANWGENMTFMIDPSSDQVGQATGIKILEELWKLAHGPEYEDIPEECRKYIKADRTFQTGMDAMWHRFSSGRLRISRNLLSLLEQYGSYAWNKDGDGPKEETPSLRYDIITSLRYGVMGLSDYAHGLDRAPWEPELEFESTIDIKDWKPYRAGRSND